MIDEMQTLLEDYSNWIKNKTALRRIDEWIEITTPYLDRHNDYLQIYAKREGNDFLLTDDGYILSDLRMSGCDLDTARRQDILKTTLNGFGVSLDGDALVVRASAQDFAIQKHNLVQAMLAVNDMFYLAMPMVTNLFYEDVSKWFDFNDIRYTPKATFTGKSGLIHHFDFVIPKSKHRPERIVQAINKPNRDKVQSYTFAWIDTRETRPIQSQAYAILNDSDVTPSTSIISTLRSWDVHPILWSQREQIKQELAV
ncbi:MAG: DUF1829 domain-containing protein [Chloroflexota bacterium]|nr:DUF1829 domain-containing protein [Chloroflexota bacterium]